MHHLQMESLLLRSGAQGVTVIDQGHGPTFQPTSVETDLQAGAQYKYESVFISTQTLIVKSKYPLQTKQH
ncbi:unnamed protein product [Urochloa humidicola]